MSTKASLFVVYLLLHFMTVQTAEDTSSHHDANQHVHHKHHTADAQHSSPPMKTSPTTGHMNHHHNQHAGNDHIPTEEDPTMAGGKHAHEQGDHVNNNQQHQQSHGSGHSMMMYFHLSSDTPLFFEGWSLNSAGAIAGATIVLIIVSALYEGLKTLRERLMRRTLKDVAERELEGHKTTCCKDAHSPEGPCNDQSEYIRLPLLSHVLQTVMHIIQVLISYLLMLAVMTYNIWLFLGVLVGSGIGYFAMSWYMPRTQQSYVSKMSEHCH